VVADRIFLFGAALFVFAVVLAFLLWVGTWPTCPAGEHQRGRGWTASCVADG